MRLKVCETFVSLQGEGLRVGEPSLFLRLSGCNLRCPFCDTRYSWDEGEWLDLDYLCDLVVSHNLPLVVTGGEPTLQAEALLELVVRLREASFTKPITIETNGSVVSDKIIDLLNVIDLISLSPKLSSFAKAMIDFNIVLSIAQKFRDKVYLKLVVSSFDDLKEVVGLLRVLAEGGVEGLDVFVQPNSELVSDLDHYIGLCADMWSWTIEWQRAVNREELNFRLRFLPQLHRLFFWDRPRGV